MRHLLLIPVLLAAFSLPAAAQAPQQRLFAYPAPPSDSYRRTVNVRYADADGVPLEMDVFRPAADAPAPALVFFNRATGADRSTGFYGEWAKVAASRGLVAVTPDLRDGQEAADFRRLVPYLVAHAGELGIDPQRVAVYAGSGNVWAAFPAVEDPALTAIKAAVIYYGYGDVETFRLDLPVLWVRAGLDRPAMNGGINTVLTRALAQNAPLTLVNDATGHHAFEISDPDAVTAHTIDRTIEFVVHATAPAYQAALRAGMPEASAMAQIGAGHYDRAAEIYAGMLRDRPEDARLRLTYGEALLGDRQFTAACREFEKLKAANLGARDRGLPAARACLQGGDAAAAVAWLATIPARFLGREDLERDPILAPLLDRPDVQALLRRPR
jgi:dienelactone hydrolase